VEIVKRRARGYTTVFRMRWSMSTATVAARVELEAEVEKYLCMKNYFV